MDLRERFAPYGDDIFAAYAEEKDAIVDVFNNTEVYLRGLRVMGYTKVGISVVPRLLFPRYEEGRFMSTHDPETRRVITLTDTFEDDEPDLIVRATSKGLTSVLRDADWVVQPRNYLAAIAKYGPWSETRVFAPGPRTEDKLELGKLMFKMYEILRSPQAPSHLRP